MTIPIPIRVKLTLWYSLTMVATLLIFSYVSFRLVEQNLYSAVDRSLLQSINMLQSTIPSDIQNFAEKDSTGSIDYFRISQNDWVIYESQNWSSMEINEAINLPGSINWHSHDGRIFRVMTTLHKSGTNINNDIVVSVAENTEQIESSLHKLTRVFSVGLPVVFIFTVTIGYFLARRSLSPLREITREVKHINADRLDQRIAISIPNDEIGDLGQALNVGFERLEQAFFRLQRFTSDASHELRTPLTVIRSVGELGLRQSSSLTAKNDTISSMLEEVARLEQLVDSLLLLARSDTGKGLVDKESVDISSLLRDVVDCLEILADEKQQKIVLAVEPDIKLDIQKDYLQRALFNVLDNAIRYTPQGGTIEVKLFRAGKRVNIEIQDTGPGIPSQESEKIFERFYRLDDARSRGTGGSGLGLALARWGVEINGASIVHRQADHNHGSKFVIRF